GTARVTFLTATIAAYASVRLVAGLLLALGPLFIALLLFEGTRSLFEGWVRGLVAAILGAVAVTILLGVE
ncbi:type IV secretion system protein, partial [Serratia marcescens]